MKQAEDPYHALDGRELHRLVHMDLHLNVRSGPRAGKNVLLWLVPFVLAPLPTLMLFILFLQRK